MARSCALRSGTVAEIAILPPRCSAKTGSSGSGVSVCKSISVATMVGIPRDVPYVLIGTDQVAGAASVPLIAPATAGSHGLCPAASLSYWTVTTEGAGHRWCQQAGQCDERRGADQHADPSRCFGEVERDDELDDLGHDQRAPGPLLALRDAPSGPGLETA